MSTEEDGGTALRQSARLCGRVQQPDERIMPTTGFKALMVSDQLRRVGMRSLNDFDITKQKLRIVIT